VSERQANRKQIPATAEAANGIFLNHGKHGKHGSLEETATTAMASGIFAISSPAKIAISRPHPPATHFLLHFLQDTVQYH
jgi:hypothetical protein